MRSLVRMLRPNVGEKVPSAKALANPIGPRISRQHRGEEPLLFRYTMLDIWPAKCQNCGKSPAAFRDKPLLLTFKSQIISMYVRSIFKT